MYNSIVIISKLISVTVGFLVKMDSACLELATQILSDSDHSTMVAPTTLKQASLMIKHVFDQKPYCVFFPFFYVCSSTMRYVTSAKNLEKYKKNQFPTINY